MCMITRRISRIAAAVVLAAALLLTTGGCTQNGNGYVYYLNYKPEADRALKDIAKLYTEQTGVPVKIITAASGSYPTTLGTQMNKSSPPTLFVCESVKDITNWGDYCYDLRNSRQFCDLIEDTDLCVYSGTGELRGIGYCSEAYGIIVNKELLAKAGYDVSDIYNFDTLKRVAEDIHSRSGELGFNAFTSSGLDSSSSWRFSTHLANLPLFYEFRENGIREQPSKIYGKYLYLYKNVWDLYINNTADHRTDLSSVSVNMAQEEFGSGKAVFYQNGTWEYQNLTDKDKYGMDPDTLTMIPIYCGMNGEENAGLCCGSANFWSVNSHAGQKDIDATIDFICWLLTSDEGKQMMSDSFGVTPFKGHIDPDNVFFKAASAYETDMHYNVTWVFGLIPNSVQWYAGLTSALVNYSCGNGSWTDVENAFVGSWKYHYRLENNIID